MNTTTNYDLTTIEQKLKFSSTFNYIAMSQFFKRTISKDSKDILSVMQRHALQLIANIDNSHAQQASYTM